MLRNTPENRTSVYIDEISFHVEDINASIEMDSSSKVRFAASFDSTLPQKMTGFIY